MVLQIAIFFQLDSLHFVSVTLRRHRNIKNVITLITQKSKNMAAHLTFILHGLMLYIQIKASEMCLNKHTLVCVKKVTWKEPTWNKIDKNGT